MLSEPNSVAQYPKHLLQESYSSNVQGIGRQIKASNGRPTSNTPTFFSGCFRVLLHNQTLLLKPHFDVFILHI